jgi:hypothetical protein
MDKQTRTAVELEAMIMSEMLDLAECPDGMSVSVKPISDSWEALTLSRNQIAYADCVARVTLIAAKLKQQFDLADGCVRDPAPDALRFIRSRTPRLGIRLSARSDGTCELSENCQRTARILKV